MYNFALSKHLFSIYVFFSGHVWYVYYAISLVCVLCAVCVVCVSGICSVYMCVQGVLCTCVLGLCVYGIYVHRIVFMQVKHLLLNSIPNMNHFIIMTKLYFLIEDNRIRIFQHPTFFQSYFPTSISLYQDSHVLSVILSINTALECFVLAQLQFYFLLKVVTPEFGEQAPQCLRTQKSTVTVKALEMLKAEGHFQRHLGEEVDVTANLPRP